jgi:DNA repair ATPase RecN
MDDLEFLRTLITRLTDELFRLTDLNRKYLARIHELTDQLNEADETLCLMTEQINETTIYPN